jgi:hypothetical protein
MRLFLGVMVGLLGVLLAYYRFRSVARPARPEDAGSVSDAWRAEQRRQSDDL